MPHDSLLVNNRATKQHTYDAIVVGSGISGGWAAKELCEKGLRVLLLDRGAPIEHPGYPTANKDIWEFDHRLRVPEKIKQAQSVQSRHWSFREDNQHFFINDQQNPYEEKKRFDWIRADVVGGRSLLWSRACYRLSDLDFEANIKEGIAIDWPIRYKDLAPWYDYVESFVGVSGQAEGLRHLPDGIFQPPFEMNAPEKQFKTRIESKYNDRKVIMGRTANLTAPVKGRGQCQARDLCYRGCPFGAYFSTHSSTLPAAMATGKLTVLSHALVNRVLYDEQRQRATGVEVVDTVSKQVTEYFASIIFLNASTVATTSILLHSKSKRFLNGMGNGSDQLGRNLMDHHKGVSASASVEGFDNSYYYGRRPTGLYIPRFKNIEHKEADFLRGYHYGAGAYRGRREAEGIGASFKDACTEPGPWHIDLYAFGECLPYSDNRITLSNDDKDQWGRPLVQIDCEFKANEKAMHTDMVTTAQEMLDAAGYDNVQVSSSMSFPGNANHEMGTARMGHDPKTSVLNAFNQLHEVANVFVTDGACMTSNSCVNPSLTYMALTARACDYAVQELKRQNI